ncbi:hypothetical protein V8E51_004423 [Hyaloscypha variabilis]
MSRSYVEASARSITFSKAIRYELTRKLEEPVPTAATSYDDTSDAISEAILWEIEQTFNTVPTREVHSDDKCERFALTLLSDDEMIGDEDGMILLQATSSPLVEQDSMAKSRSKHGSFISYSQFHSEDCSPYRARAAIMAVELSPFGLSWAYIISLKKAQRSLHHKKRPYAWRQPFKNKRSVIRKRLLEARPASYKEKANMENAINKPENTNTRPEDADVVPGDDFNVDELFEETDEESLDHKFDIDETCEETDEEEVTMINDYTSSENELGVEEEENDLFVSKPKHVRIIPPSNSRQLVSLIRKKMSELYDLVQVKLADSEGVPDFELAERIRGAVDKVKFDKAVDLSAADIITLHEALSLLEENQLAIDF